ncbi:MAG TPA: SRPBCC family protein [Bacteroidia bacterium]|nr:SRPBCC family protein [Bacteroidia bacterium]HNT79805.1 SRPBCC family protein [Bacteroidia bacterium]
MKVLKYVLIAILLLVAAFFLVGIINPKVEYNASIEINKPLEETFELFNNIDHLQAWIPEVKSVEVMEGEPHEAGAKLRMTVESEGNAVVLNETVLEYVPNQKVVLDFEAGAMLKTNSVQFTAKGDQTIIEGSYVCRGSNMFYRSMFRFFKGTFQTIDQGYLNNFKKFADNHISEQSNEMSVDTTKSLIQ